MITTIGAAKRQLLALAGVLNELSNGRAPYSVEQDSTILTQSLESANDTVRAMHCVRRFEVLNLWNEPPLSSGYLTTCKRSAGRITGAFERIFVIDPRFDMDGPPISPPDGEDKNKQLN